MYLGAGVLERGQHQPTRRARGRAGRRGGGGTGVGVGDPCGAGLVPAAGVVGTGSLGGDVVEPGVAVGGGQDDVPDLRGLDPPRFEQAHRRLGGPQEPGAFVGGLFDAQAGGAGEELGQVHAFLLAAGQGGADLCLAADHQVAEDGAGGSEGCQDGAEGHGAADPDDFQDLVCQASHVPVGAGEDLGTLVDHEHDLRDVRADREEVGVGLGHEVLVGDLAAFGDGDRRVQHAVGFLRGGGEPVDPRPYRLPAARGEGGADPGQAGGSGIQVDDPGQHVRGTGEPGQHRVDPVRLARPGGPGRQRALFAQEHWHRPSVGADAPGQAGVDGQGAVVVGVGDVLGEDVDGGDVDQDAALVDAG